MAKNLHNRVNRRELKERLLQSNERRVTLSFYKYVQLPAPAAFRDELYLTWKKLGVMGRVYVAREGVNAQISVPEQNFEAFKTALNAYDFFQNMRLNVAVDDDGKSFFTLAIKVRDKIVADGIEDPAFNPSDTGTHLNHSRGRCQFSKTSDTPWRSGIYKKILSQRFTRLKIVTP